MFGRAVLGVGASDQKDLFRMTWGKPGKGKCLTVYSNPGHAYLVVAGLRFDTSMTPGDGPGWSKSMRSTSGRFVARSWRGF